MKKTLLTILCIVLLTSACGGVGGDEAGAFLEAIEASAEAASEVDSDAAEAAAFGNSNDVVTPEGSGELPMNSFRIGEQIWMRTMPMTTGQCWVTDDNADGNGLPASTLVWGTLDGDEGTKFRAQMTQQGDFDILVDDQQTFHWLGGQRAADSNEIAFTFDYENNIVRGSGIFWNAFSNERAQGSFVFQCDPTT